MVQPQTRRGTVYRTLRSPLAWRLAGVVFLAILFIEAVILVPSVMRFDDDLHKRMRGEGEAIFRIVDASGTEGEAARMRALLGALDVGSISGGALIFGDGRPPFTIGDPPDVAEPLPAGRPFLETMNIARQAHDMAWRGGGEGAPYTFALRFNTTHVSAEIWAFVLRVGALTLVISIFTTIVIMSMVSGQVLGPMTSLRGALVAAKGDVGALQLAETGLRRGDEIGDLYRGVAQLVAEIGDNVREIEALARLPSENPSPVLRCRPDGGILLANAAASGMTDLFADAEQSRLAESLRYLAERAFATGEARVSEFWHGKQTLSFSAHPIVEAGYVNIYGRDISDQIAAEAELRAANANLEREVERRTEKLRLNEAQLTRNIQDLERSQRDLKQRTEDLSELARKYAREKERALASERVKSEFLATMSHEIRTPMTGILGLADILLESDLPAAHHDTVQKLRGAGESLVTIINDILDLSKIQAGKLEIEHIDFNIQQLVRDVLELIRPKAEDKGLSLSLELDADLPGTVNADPTRIRQILLNLVGNAVKFTRQGAVKVAITHDDIDDRRFKLQFYVIDSGIGIPAAAQEALFNDFTQADSSTSRNYEGTGLGLAICKRLCGLMGGEIGVVSAVDEGSTFWFTLTVERAPTDVAVTTKTATTGFSAVRPLAILLAEDNPLNQLIVKSFLEPLGHRLAVVDTGAAALAAVQDGNFDLVLMDVRMPEMNGIEATRSIRRLPAPKNTLPVIAVTADALSDHVATYMAAGMNICVTKPIDRSRLIDAIDEVLGEKVHRAGGVAAEVDPVDARPEPETPPSAEVLDFLNRLNNHSDNAN